MDAEQKPREAVVTYTVSNNGSTNKIEEVNKLIAEGYRVVDIISTPTGSSSSGFVSITVLLRFDPKQDGSDNYYHKYEK